MSEENIITTTEKTFKKKRIKKSINNDIIEKKFNTIIAKAIKKKPLNNAKPEKN